MKIRKPVNELTLADLNRFPVWMYALDEETEDGQDETTVRPHKIIGALDPSRESFIARARFILNDGTRMQGFITPRVRGDNDMGTLQPVIVTQRGHVGFWYGALAVDANALAQCYETLGKVSHEVFPLRVESDVELTDGPIMAEIPGFMNLDEVIT